MNQPQSFPIQQQSNQSNSMLYTFQPSSPQNQRNIVQPGNNQLPILGNMINSVPVNNPGLYQNTISYVQSIPQHMQQPNSPSMRTNLQQMNQNPNVLKFNQPNQFYAVQSTQIANPTVQTQTSFQKLSVDLNNHK